MLRYVFSAANDISRSFTSLLLAILSFPQHLLQVVTKRRSVRKVCASCFSSSKAPAASLHQKTNHSKAQRHIFNRRPSHYCSLTLSPIHFRTSCTLRLTTFAIFSIGSPISVMERTVPFTEKAKTRRHLRFHLHGRICAFYSVILYSIWRFPLLPTSKNPFRVLHALFRRCRDSL